MLRNAHVYGRKLAKAGIAPLHPAIIEGSFPGYVCTIKFGPLFPKLVPGKFGKRGGNGTKVVGRWVRLLDLKDIWISPNHFWRHRFNTLGRRHGLATDIVGALVEGAHARRSQPVAGLRRTAALCGRCRRQCRRSCRPGGDRTGHELPVAGSIRGALAYERGLRAARRHRRSRLLPRAAGPLAPDVRPSVCRREPEWWASVCGQTEERLLGDLGPRAKYPSSVLFTPYLSGEWTPHNDPHMRGGFSRLGHATDRAAMTQAVLEGVAFWI